MGKKTPFYRWGKIQPLCSQPAQSGTTAPRSGTTARAVEPLRNTTARRQKASRTAGAVLPLVLTVLPLGVAVLLLASKRYYRTAVRYYRTDPQYCCSPSTELINRRTGAGGGTSTRAVLLRPPMRYYREAKVPARGKRKLPCLLPQRNGSRKNPTQ